ncbi:MAG: type II toxin-antitoxin system Phd/YefM family antitoxin [Desulfobacterales bacterium]|jgi:antitoxin StbD|nr:type II toxin-antitoxin system Phd/YefM family antitoxin [Desulfobacterales bacterium]MCD4805826.1 type II toxin-antitoxin system Phd/YefM family antitoxin [Desulfobacterales bacterium]
MLIKIHAELTTSISDMKRNPQALIDSAHGETIVLLNRNKPTAYIVPAKTYERLMDLAEDIELGRIIEERKDEKKEAVEVGIDDL